MKEEEKKLLESGKEKAKEIKDKVIEKVNDYKDGKKTKEANVVCRVLFSSILDKIYLICLGIYILYILLILLNAKFSMVGTLLSVIHIVILYLLSNWFYKCVRKTMLCITDKEVYVEKYIPLYRSEVSIPLDKITRISTINMIWIFRAVVIFQYDKFLPVIFWTWNNQEFKDEACKLITKEDKKIINEYADKNLINNWNDLVKIFGVLVAIVLFIGLVKLCSYITSPERKIAGTYTNNGNAIVLNKNGSCNVDDIVSYTVKSCEWKYVESTKNVLVTYTYEKTSGYYKSYTYTYDNDITLSINTKNKTVTYDNTVYSK